RFSLLRAKNIKGYGSFLADPIKGVEVVDPRTVRIELNEPDATFLAALAAGVFSSVDSKAAKAAGGVETADADKEDKAEQWFYTNSAGTGPYRLVRYTRETEIVLERNDRYFGAKPFFRQVIIKHIKDPSTQALMLQRGDADVALDLSVDQAEDLKGKPGIQLFEDFSGWTVWRRSCAPTWSGSALTCSSSRCRRPSSSPNTGRASRRRRSASGSPISWTRTTGRTSSPASSTGDCTGSLLKASASSTRPGKPPTNSSAPPSTPSTISCWPCRIAHTSSSFSLPT